MTHYSKLGTETGVEITAPLRTLHHSHAAILFQLESLEELPALVPQVDRARQIAAAALVLFRNEVLRHHAEEERELFPAVLASAAPGDEQDLVQDLSGRLRAQHRSLERLWHAVEPGLKGVARGRTELLDLPSVLRLVELYAEHMRLEETEFLPRAQQILGRNANHLEALGVALHMRRLPPVVGHI